MSHATPSMPPPPALALHAGEDHLQRLPAGSRIHVLEGRLVLHEPLQWLAERAWQASVPLAAGMQHRLARGGWVRLQATAAARLHIEPPPPGPLARAWARLPAPAQRSGIGVARSTATAVTLFCGEPSMTRSE